MDQEPVPSNSPLGQALVWVSRITVIGLQMVVPGVVGGYADRAWGTSFLAPIGFVLGFIGREDNNGRYYHYSQMAGTDPGWQNRGVGLAQQALRAARGNPLWESRRAI